MIQYAFDQRVEELLMKRWIMHYQDQVSFDEFKKQLGANSKKNIDNRSAEQILEEVKKILQKD
ncbi:hypothetical protein [Abyssisolibacter fermentans]|uniref:hypothetical protein n=1 Tax=Abyssisolibacter fermentans TaxID=1766203 RepID=UPI00082CBE41|nr:hypothetical protein [Abyssisolibacter fermentans]